jgi:hypothetical protein
MPYAPIDPETRRREMNAQAKAAAVAAFTPGVHPATDLALDLAEAAPTARVIGILAQLDAEAAGFLAAELKRRSDMGVSLAEDAFNLAGAVVTATPDLDYARNQLAEAVGMGNIDHDRMRRAGDALDRVAAELARVQPQALAVIEQAAQAEAQAHDPHCTCNDCVADHAAQQAEALDAEASPVSLPIGMDRMD